MTDYTDDNDNGRLADRFEQCRDDELTGYTSATFRKVGTGKTQQLGTELARRVADTDSSEVIDPKGGGEKNGG